LAACQRKRLRFLRFSFTQRTQRKRLRLSGNWASVVVVGENDDDVTGDCDEQTRQRTERKHETRKKPVVT